MKARPILFSAPMIRALLDGQKTQTRMVVKPQPHDINHRTSKEVNAAWQEGFIPVQCPFGKKGDFLWLRENGMQPPFITAKMLCDGADTWPEYIYDADDKWVIEEFKHLGWKRRPSIHMPRWASRLTLEITDVRVARLQEINRGDAMEEGCPFPNMQHEENPIKWYAALWESLNGPGSWDQNPWVWVIEFTVHHCNVDELIKQREAA